MKSRLMQNSIFAWLGIATVLLLCIPLVAMGFTSAVNWGLLDFVLMALILFSGGSIFILLARKVPRQQWIYLGAVIALAVLYIWAEFAVGIFTDIGS